MNKIRFIALLISVFIIQAQQLDEDYLESLPDDIKEDLMKRSDKNNQSSKENYRASIYSSKLEEAEDLMKLKTRIEDSLSELQKRLNSDQKITLAKEMKLFGSEFFSTFQTSYMPINEPNLDTDYILDSGDILRIQFVGQQDLDDTYIINRDGSIMISDIGKLNLAGLNLSDASTLIKSNVRKAYIGTEAFISLSEIRDVNVLVSGNAKNPGIYTLNGNSNILHALSVAGGINEYGSYREINLVRNNKVVETLDMYDLLINGNYNLKKNLRTGDVIFVESRKLVISIDGAIKRPAKYELQKEEFLSSALNFANGLKNTADLENIYLERMLDGTLKSIPIRNISQFQSITPYDNDLIYVREHDYRLATISGAVYKPGSYIMASGETVNDLIEKAGGYTDSAYPFGAIYENLDAKKINDEAQDLLYEEFLDNIIALSQLNMGENFDLTPIIKLTEKIKNTKPSGRVVIDFTNDDFSPGIQDGDKILIPEAVNSVYVYGEVSSEGAVGYEANQGVDFFVKKSGGYKKFADIESVYILHPNGETERYSKKRNVFANQPTNIDIYPGSVIFIPRKIDNSASKRLATQAYVSILGNLGIALASLSSIDNN